MKKPHEILLEWALEEGALMPDVIITKDGEVREILRPLSIKERLECLKASAPFYAPTLKSIEAKAALDIENLSLDELKAKLTRVLADQIKQERKAH